MKRLARLHRYRFLKCVGFIILVFFTIRMYNKKSNLHKKIIVSKKTIYKKVNKEIFSEEDKMKQIVQDIISYDLINTKHEFYADMYALENGGSPLRTLIISNWAPGLSLLGEVLNHFPHMFYFHEPLHQFISRTNKTSEDEIRYIKKLFRCEYSGIEEYLKSLKEKELKFFSKLLRDKVCSIKQMLCKEAYFLSQICEMFPFQIMSETQLRLSGIRRLISDDVHLNIKAIYLVADPREIFVSSSCSFKDCVDMRRLCSKIFTDYFSAVRLIHDYPEKFIILRYEDLLLDVYNVTNIILKYLDLGPHALVDKYLSTKANVLPQNNLKNEISREMPFRWTQVIDMKDLLYVQNKCKKALKHWGYVLARSESHLRSETFVPMKTLVVNYNDILD